MGDNYRLRVGAFIKKMIQEPKVVDDMVTDKLNGQSIAQEADPFAASTYDLSTANEPRRDHTRVNSNAAHLLQRSYDQMSVVQSDLQGSLRTAGDERLQSTTGALPRSQHDVNLLFPMTNKNQSPLYQDF